MSKLMRGLVLGAMVAVLSSATAAAAPPQQPLSRTDAVQEFRAGERAELGQPVSNDQAVQEFRAGERTALSQPVSNDQAAVQRFRAGERATTISDTAASQALAQQRRAYYESTRPVAAPAQPSVPDSDSGTPVALLVALGAAAVLAIGLDAMSVRRKTRKAVHPAI